MVCTFCDTELDYACCCTWLDEISAQWTNGGSDTSGHKFEFQFADPKLRRKSFFRQLIANLTGEFQASVEAHLAEFGQPYPGTQPQQSAPLLNPYDDPDYSSGTHAAPSLPFVSPAGLSTAYYLTTPLHHPRPIRNLHANICELESACESEASADSLAFGGNASCTCQDSPRTDESPPSSYSSSSKFTNLTLDEHISILLHIIFTGSLTSEVFATFSPPGYSGTPSNRHSLSKHQANLLHVRKKGLLPTMPGWLQLQQAAYSSSTEHANAVLANLLWALQEKEATQERKRAQGFFNAQGDAAFLNSGDPGETLPDRKPQSQHASKWSAFERPSHATPPQHNGQGLERVAGRTFCHECNRWTDEDEPEEEGDSASAAESDDSSTPSHDGYFRLLNDIIANSDFPAVIQGAQQLRSSFLTYSKASRQEVSVALMPKAFALWKLVMKLPEDAE